MFYTDKERKHTECLINNWQKGFKSHIEQLISEKTNILYKEIDALEERVFLIENPYKFDLLSDITYNGIKHVIISRYCMKQYISEEEETDELNFFKYYTVKNIDGKEIDLIESEI